MFYILRNIYRVKNSQSLYVSLFIHNRVHRRLFLAFAIFVANLPYKFIKTSRFSPPLRTVEVQTVRIRIHFLRIHEVTDNKS